MDETNAINRRSLSKSLEVIPIKPKKPDGGYGY